MSAHGLSADRLEWIANRSAQLLQSLKQDACVLGLGVSHLENGAAVIDCGVKASGSLEAGRRITEISQGGMASARLGTTEIAGTVLPELTVDSWLPKVSAYGLQVSIPLSEVDPAIRVSGPILARCSEGRFEARREDLGNSAWGIAVVEAEDLPSERLSDALARRSGLSPADLNLIVVPSNSLAGATQIAGRINECVLFTLEESLGIDCSCISQILASVPVSLSLDIGAGHPVTPDDFIHYLGRVVLSVTSDTGMDWEPVASQLVFRSTSAYGTLFSQLLADAGGVFEDIPGLIDLNKVAQVTVIDSLSGRSFSAGDRNESILLAALRNAETDSKETS